MLINPSLANLKVATAYGNIVFNDKGENNDLKPEEQKVLGALRGFSYKEDKKPFPALKDGAEVKSKAIAKKKPEPKE